MAAAPDVPSLTWVPIAAEHLSAWHRLVDVCTEADDGDEHLTLEDLADELEPEWLDPERDAVLGLDPDGVARAFGMTTARPGATTEQKVTLWGAVDPELRGRGIGRELLRWQVDRAREQDPGDGGPVRGYVYAKEGVGTVDRLLDRAGFERVRFSHVMRRPLPKAGGTLPEPVVPDGVRLAGYTEDLAEPLRLVHNEAFAAHWGFVPWTADEWRLWTVGHRWFRPDWSVVAYVGDRIAGYAVSAGFEPDWTALGLTEGWTGKLGVLPEFRGRGIAKALLAESMRRFAADGIEHAGLDVDTENTSGAVALYTGLGYAVRSTTATWRRELT